MKPKITVTLVGIFLAMVWSVTSISEYPRAIEKDQDSQSTPTVTPTEQTLIDTAKLTQITVNNAKQLTQLAQLGRGTARKAAWSPDGKLFAVAGSLGIWLYQAGSLSSEPRLLAETIAVNDVAFSPDGTLIAAGDNDGLVKLWNAKTYVVQTVLKGHTGPVNAIAFSHDGKLLASGSGTGNFAAPNWRLGDNMVRLWDVNSGTLLRTLQGHTDGINGVAFSPDDSLLASASDDDTVRLWDVKTGALHSVLDDQCHSQTTPCGENSVAFSPDGKTLASAEEQSEIQLWDVQSGTKRDVWGDYVNDPMSLAYSPDGARLVETNSSVHIFDTKTGQEDISSNVWQIKGLVLFVAFNPDGTILTTITATGLVQLWNLTKNATNIFSRQYASGDGLWHTLLSPKGTYAAVSDDGKAQLWNLHSGDEHDFGGIEYDYLPLMAISPDEAYFAYTSLVNTPKLEGTQVHVWDGQNDRVVATDQYVGTGVMIFSPTQPILAYSFGSTMHLLDVVSGKDRATLATGASTWAFSPDGSLLASTDEDGKLMLWDVNTGKEITTLTGVTGYGYARPIFSPDGSLLAFFDDKDSIIHLWSIAAKKDLFQLPARITDNWPITFNPDGSLFATVDEKTMTITLWNSATGKQQAMFNICNEPTSIPAFSPDGSLLVDGCFDHIFQLWDVDTGKEVAALDGHTAPISTVGFTNDGNLVISTSLDGTIRLWGISK